MDTVEVAYLVAGYTVNEKFTGHRITFHMTTEGTIVTMYDEDLNVVETIGYREAVRIHRKHKGQQGKVADGKG